MRSRLRKFMADPSWFTSIRRSRNGLVLGVFKGIAESKGWNCAWTRIGGAFGLLIISGAIGNGDFSNFFIAAFFYLLLAVLIPSENGETLFAPSSAASPSSSDANADPATGLLARGLERQGFELSTHVTRPDLLDLSRQMERLNRRIQRMEGVVTNRSYEWERRIRSESN